MKAPPEEPSWEALVPAVGEDHFQARHLSKQLLEHRWGRLGVVLIGRMHYNCQKQPPRTGDYVPLPTIHLLVRAALGLGPAPLGHASGPSNPVAEPLKEVQLSPFPEMVVDGLPGRKFVG